MKVALEEVRFREVIFVPGAPDKVFRHDKPKGLRLWHIAEGIVIQRPEGKEMLITEPCTLLPLEDIKFSQGKHLKERDRAEKEVAKIKEAINKNVEK
jgi:hypothetical protein